MFCAFLQCWQQAPCSLHCPTCSLEEQQALLEISLLEGSRCLFDSIVVDIENQGLKNLVGALLDARYQEVLASFAPWYTTGSPPADGDYEAFFRENLRLETSGWRNRDFKLLILGVASLNLFVQCNWAGVPAPIRDRSLNSNSLCVDGEDARNCDHPHLLLFARVIFGQPIACSSASWWMFRCLWVHHSVMSVHTQTLQAALTDVTAQVQSDLHRLFAVAGFSPLDEPPPSDDKDAPPLPIDGAVDTPEETLKRGLLIDLLLELASMNLEFWRQDNAKALLDRAVGMEQLSVKLSGVKGLRTKFQQEEKTLAIVLVKSAHPFKGLVGPKNHLPKDLVLDDEVLLETPTLRDSHLEKPEPLPLCEQRLLYGLSEHLRRTHPHKDEITRLELSAFMTRILLDLPNTPRSFGTQVVALLRRSLIEIDDTHLNLRSLQQLEELVASLAPTDVSCEFARLRMEGVYSSMLPSCWELKRQIADCFFERSFFKSALDLYQQVNDLERLIESYLKSGRGGAAEALIKEEIQKHGETPALLCFLGDINNDPSYYVKAWELSKSSYPKAQRLLAQYERTHNRLPEAIIAYELALAINSSFPDCWFCLGWCAFETGDWKKAAMAYSRACSLDYEYADAWNNLASAHLKLKNDDPNAHLRPALQALDQALRFKRDHFGVWENYLSVALELKEIDKSINAVEHLVRLKKPVSHQGPYDEKQDGKLVPEGVLLLLARIVAEEAKKNPEQWVVQRFQKLLDNVSVIASGYWEVWAAQAGLSAALGDKARSIDAREKQLRCLQTGKWEDDAEQFSLVVQTLKLLVAAYLELPTSENLLAARLAVESAQFAAEKAGKDSTPLKELLVTLPAPPRPAVAEPPAYASAFSDWA